MPVTKQSKLNTKVQYDPGRNRTYVNGVDTVLHCHHYATLYSQLADDATLFDGRAILRDTAEHTFYKVLSDYNERYKVEQAKDRFAAAQQYWAFCGMGNLEFAEFSENGGKVQMNSSHVDEGWIKKWGKREKPVNFITQGYLCAVFAAVYNQPQGSYKVSETQSIVSGADKSVFSVGRK